MSDIVYAQEELLVRSTIPTIARNWTNHKCILTNNAFKYYKDDPKVPVETIQLSSIEKVDTWTNSKTSSEEQCVFQIRARNDVTLHQCKTKEDCDNWIYKVMKVMAGENPNSPMLKASDKKKSKLFERSSEDSDSTDSDSDGEMESSKSKGKKDDEKREERRKKLKSKVSKKKLVSKNKVTTSNTTKPKKKKKSKKTRDRSHSTSQDSDQDTKDTTTQQENEVDLDYIQERLAYFDDIPTEELVKLTTIKLDEAFERAKKELIDEWATKKRKLLTNLHRAEKLDLEESFKSNLENVDTKMKELLSR